MKIPEPRKLKSGNYFTQLRLGGNSISVTASTEKECRDKATLIKAEYRAGKRQTEGNKENPTLEHAIDNYIASRSNILSPSTIRGYEAIKRTRFLPYMNISLSKLNETDFRKMVNAEAALCSPKTLKNSWRFVSSCIYEAIGERYSVNLPQQIESEHKFLDYQQIEAFVKLIQGEPVEIPALLALSSMRRSEIAGLKWDNVDLKNGLITVSGARVFGANQKLVEKKANKNKTSNRIIPIMMPQLLKALLDVIDKTGFVVKERPHTICRQVNRICKRNGLPEIGTHGLRHSFASLAYHLGIPEKVAMEIGGWSNDATMKKIYTHIAKSDVLYYQNKMANYYQEIANENANKK